MEIIELRDEYIKLGQALKAAGLVSSGVDAKMVIQDGLVKVNGQVELQRGKKLYEAETLGYKLATKEEIEELGNQGIFLHYNSIKDVFV